MERGALAVGSIFAGNYRIERVQRRAELSTTYAAQSERTGKIRALEIIAIDLRNRRELRERFVAESKASARIESEHVATVFDAGVDEPTGAPWIELELLEGETLAARIERAPLSAIEAQDLVAQLGHGLGAAHRQQLVHGDLKPESVFLSKHWKPGRPFLVSLLDFGVARFISEARAVLGVTASMSTPVWMAPEQSEAGKALSPATDVWALGLVVFRALTGKHYWSEIYRPGSNMASTLMEVLTRPLAAASQRARELGVAAPLPAGFDGWFSRCVDRDPSQRFADATTASSAFDALSAAPTVFEPRASPGAGTVPSPSFGELSARASYPGATTAPQPIAPTQLPAAPIGSGTLFAPPAGPAFVQPAAMQPLPMQATVMAPATAMRASQPGPPAPQRTTPQPSPPAGYGVSGTMLQPLDLATRSSGAIGPSGTFVVPAQYVSAPPAQPAQPIAHIPTHPSRASHPSAQGPVASPQQHPQRGGGGGGGIAIAILSVLGLGFGGLVIYELVHRGAPTTPTNTNDVEPTSTRPAATGAGAGGSDPAASNAWIRVDPPPSPWMLGVDSNDESPLVLGFRPSRQVATPSASFEMQQHEVTWGELDPWLKGAGDVKFPAPAGTPSDPSTRGSLPATAVPWLTAGAYCKSIGASLPTEQQWELAARGKERRRYAWGESGIDLATMHAFAGAGARVMPVMSNDQDRTPGPAEKAIWDLMGNAQEWTGDLYREDWPGHDESWTQGAAGTSFRTLRGFRLGDEPFPATLSTVGAGFREPACATGPCAAPGAIDNGAPRLLMRAAFVDSGAGMSGATKPIFTSALADVSGDLARCPADRGVDDAIVKVVFARPTKAQSGCVDSDGYAADMQCCNDGDCSFVKSDPLKVTVTSLTDPSIASSGGPSGACAQKVIEGRLAKDGKPAPVKWPDDADGWTAIVWSTEVPESSPRGLPYVGFRCVRGVR